MLKQSWTTNQSLNSGCVVRSGKGHVLLDFLEEPLDPCPRSKPNPLSQSGDGPKGTVGSIVTLPSAFWNFLMQTNKLDLWAYVWIRDVPFGMC